MKLIAILCSLALAVTSFAAVQRPNIIVFYTDDHGFADLGIRGIEKDVRTPHLDALAKSGVVAAHGYSTAPQCVPSRGGLMTGRFQGRFDLDNNGSSLDGFNKQTTIATRLQNAGYVTGQFGKWHLGPLAEIPRHGFRHVYAQHGGQSFSANIQADGTDRPMSEMKPEYYHLDGCSRAAASIIERYHAEPFFLYVAFRAPHTPLDAPQSYKDRFPGPMPERRRAALAMLSAVDDGVGLVTDTLKKHGLTEKTLIFLIGDNGAPLKIHKTDSPLNGDAGGWDGSLNTPLNGEKGMLAEGGMHVPFLIAWPGTIPGGQVYEHPVSALDVAATAVEVASISAKGELDGVNLIPHLTGKVKAPPHEFLAWRWMAQSAIREGKWKLLRGGEREYLYDLDSDLTEKHNLASQHPDIASRLREKLTHWCAELTPPGLALGPMAQNWNDYFDHYLEGKPVSPSPAKAKSQPGTVRGWLARNGTLEDKDGVMLFTPQNNRKAGFLTRSQLSLRAPAKVQLKLKSSASGPASVAWRVQDEKDFVPANQLPFKLESTPDWQTHTLDLPATGRIIHLRLHLPGAAEIQQLDLQPSKN
ncbi:MAG: sulfatase-like hydrolase/transferase [Verrucomicrobiaceae bacterium]|nr:sulfatase-like hydrolase/transferase [Verrucomicrobiaceae bacterium]